MPISMYEASMPVMIRGMRNLSAILEKAAASAEGRKIDLAVFVAGRLAPDMHPLNRQIQIASDSAKNAAARLTGAEPPSWPDTETTFPELQGRIRTTIDYLEGFKAEQFEGAEDRTVVLKTPGGDLSFPGKAFLLHFALPNFLFHVAIAYAILRHNGVDVGKRDFIGAV